MKVKYSYSEVGTSCDHCGRGIKHVYTVEDVVKMNVGSECIKKIMNISDFGMKVVNKATKNIRDMEILLQDFLTRDYEVLKSKHFNNSYGMIEIPWNERLPEDHAEYASYREKTIEEFKDQIEKSIKLYTYQIEAKTEDLSKQLKGVKIK